jgi:hypothetical protein
MGLQDVEALLDWELCLKESSRRVLDRSMDGSSGL